MALAMEHQIMLPRLKTIAGNHFPLQGLGLKAGGTAADRAQRLLTVKGVKREDIPVKIRDKKTFDMCTERLKRTGEL